jgi:pyruvate dehydrogenase E2 component (dihydrolipoamide acetyltransferase)
LAHKVIMPKAGMAMEEGKILRWFIKEGEWIEKGDPLLEIETDKVNMEIESMDTGYLLKIVKGEGEVVPVTKTIGYIGEKGEIIEEEAEDGTGGKVAQNLLADNTKAALETPNSIGKLEQSAGKVPATPLAKTLAKEKGIDIKGITGTGSFGEIKARDIEKAGRIKATPLASRIANDKGIDISSIEGSGHLGKVRKEDIEIFERQEEKADALRIPLKGMRKIIAERMLKSHTEIPTVTLNAKADVTELYEIRKQINQSGRNRITINDFILKAAASALKESPYINASLEGDEIVQKEEINIGMAVALEEGLIVPVIRNADKLSLNDISKRAKDLAKRARDGKLSPDEYKGGTFTVSNLGMYGIVSFTPIINQPESAILGVCSIEEELKMIGGKIEERKVMGLSLTFDHRVVDGAQSALFLNKIKSLLENPLELVIL